MAQVSLAAGALSSKRIGSRLCSPKGPLRGLAVVSNDPDMPPAGFSSPRACPTRGWTVTRMFKAADILDLPSQGIAKGESEELLRGSPYRETYANVHSKNFSGGEIRGQVRIRMAPEHVHGYLITKLPLFSC